MLSRGRLQLGGGLTPTRRLTPTPVHQIQSRPVSIASQRKQPATPDDLTAIPSWHLAQLPPSNPPIYSLPSSCSASPSASPVPQTQSLPPSTPPTSITRHLSFPTFSAAFGFITRVGLLAARLSHHPAWTNSGGKVSITLTTDDAGGMVTALDVRMAKAIDKAARECGELGQDGKRE